jgi:hypothetical protein
VQIFLSMTLLSMTLLSENGKFSPFQEVRSIVFGRELMIPSPASDPDFWSKNPPPQSGIKTKNPPRFSLGGSWLRWIAERV